MGPRKNPPGRPESDRRTYQRREEDVEQKAISDLAMHDAPIVNRLLHTGRIVGAVGLLCTAVGGISGALGYRIAGPTQDIQHLKEEIKIRSDSIEKRQALLESRG